MAAAATDKNQGERILYTTWNSTCSWRVRMVMAYKGIKATQKYIRLQASEDAVPEYININPSGVPTLVEPDGRTYTQSAAIMEYLEEAYPDSKSILPKEAGDRALCRALAQEIISGMQPLQNMAVAYLHLICRPSWKGAKSEKPLIMIGAKQFGPSGEVVNFKYLQAVLIEKFWGVENLMSRVAGTHSFGNSFTIADAALVPQAHAAYHSFGVDISQFPTIARVMQNLKKEECVLTTQPNVCEDYCPPFVPLDPVGVPLDQQVPVEEPKKK